MLFNESDERPIRLVSDAFSLFPISESPFAPIQPAIFDRQKIKQSRNQTLIPRRSAPIPTVKYMAC